MVSDDISITAGFVCVCVGTPADYYLPYPSESVSRNTHIYIYGSTIEVVSTEWVRWGDGTSCWCGGVGEDGENTRVRLVAAAQDSFGVTDTVAA